MLSRSEKPVLQGHSLMLKRNLWTNNTRMKATGYLISAPLLPTLAPIPTIHYEVHSSQGSTHQSPTTFKDFSPLGSFEAILP